METSSKGMTQMQHRRSYLRHDGYFGYLFFRLERSLFHVYAEQFANINCLFGESLVLVDGTNIAMEKGWSAIDFESNY